MHCPNCNALLEEGSAFCGNCGKQIAPLLARGATVGGDRTEIIQSNEYNNATAAETLFSPSSRPPTPAPPQQYGTLQSPAPGTYQQPPAGNASFTPSVVPPAPSGKGLNSRTVAFIAIILLLLVLSVSAGVIALNRNSAQTNTGKGGAAAATTAQTGQSTTGGATTDVVGLGSFSDGANSTTTNSTVKITANGLKPPAADHQYLAWMVDTQNESAIISLGPLVQQPDKSYAVTASTRHTNLLAVGNKLEVTLEPAGKITVPTGTVVLSGSFPPEALVHIRHLLFHFDTTPQNVGLLVGLREQAQLLQTQAQLLKNNAHNQQEVACLSQSIIDIIEGQNGTHYQQPSGTCQGLNMVEKGDGFGLLGKGYISMASLHASLAATTPDTTPTIKLHAGHVRICMDNLTKWTTTIDADANSLLTNPGDMGKLQEIITLSDHTLNGVDLDNDEHVDPVPGEGGAITGYIRGQLMAMLQLRPGA